MFFVKEILNILTGFEPYNSKVRKGIVSSTRQFLHALSSLLLTSVELHAAKWKFRYPKKTLHSRAFEVVFIFSEDRTS